MPNFVGPRRLVGAATIVTLLCSAGRAQVIRTCAGGAENDGRRASDVPLAAPAAVAIDATGNVYVVELQKHRVRRIDAMTRIVTTVAGNGLPGFSGDGGAAVAASLRDPRAIAIRSANLAIADTGNHRVRIVDLLTGTIRTVAGDGTTTFSGDGMPGWQASLQSPADIAFDGAGNLFIADSGHHRIRKVDLSGTITSVAGVGSPGFSGDGGPAVGAKLNYPRAVATDLQGRLYLAEPSNQRIRMVDPVGTITTVAGNGSPGFAGDGGPATAATLNYPGDVIVDAAGALYIADEENARIRRVDEVTKVIATMAGTGTGGFSGDGGPAANAAIGYSVTLALDGARNVFLADMANRRVRRIDGATGVIATEAGSLGDGIPATESVLAGPRHIAFDLAGNLFIADTFNHRIRRVDRVTGVIRTVAGTGFNGFSGDGGPATEARLGSPFSVAVDRLGNLFVADFDNRRIRRVDGVTGVITTIAEALSANGVAVDSGGTVYAAEAMPAGIVRLDSVNWSRTLLTPAGALGSAEALSVDAAGNLFVADALRGNVHRLDRATGIMTPVAEGLMRPSGVAVGASGDVYVSEARENRIRRIDAATKAITTVAGTGTAGYGGDGGAATAARLADPSGIAVDAAGNLHIADTSNDRVRVVSSTQPRARAVRH